MAPSAQPPPTREQLEAWRKLVIDNSVTPTEVSLQLLDQSPIAFDELIFRDLIAAYATEIDKQVIFGTGSSGQMLGVSLTPNITTITAGSTTVQSIYSAIANAIQLIHSTRLMAPEVIVMHPRRWGDLLQRLDNSGRPLFIPAANGLMNVGGVLSAVESQQVVGQVQGLSVVTDPNIQTTLGTESPTGDEDAIYVMRASDLVLWESPGPRARVLPETRATTLTVLLQVYGYRAFSAARFPQSVVEIVGLPAPTFA
jgi:HK97 family phage major capsid protein